MRIEKATWETGADGKMILKWILKTLDVILWTEFKWFRTGSSGWLL
jgi:hypothetical protein